MSFEGARFCSYDSPRALSYTVSLSLSAASVSLHLPAILSILHTFSHTSFSLAHSSPPSGSFYWAALKPDVPALLRGRAGRRGDGGGDERGGRGRRMTCSFRATHSPHNRISLHPFSRIFLPTISVLLLQDLAQIIPQKKNTPTYTNLTSSTSPLPVMQCERPSFKSNQPFDLGK